MTAIDKLDAVLHLMASDKYAIKNNQYDDIRNGMIEMYPQLSNDKNWGNDLYRILSKLDKEKYITIFEIDVYPQPALAFSVKEKRYMITFDGRVFSEEGGYSTKLKQERYKIRYEKLAMWLTAVGTALAGIYGVVEIGKWLHKLLSKGNDGL